MSVRWYADEYAKRIHIAMQDELSLVISHMCPGHELSHFGVSKDPVTDEVVIKLHLNPKGRVKVSAGEELKGPFFRIGE